MTPTHGGRRSLSACFNPICVGVLLLLTAWPAAARGQECADSAAMSAWRTGFRQIAEPPVPCELVAELRRAHAHGGWHLAVLFGDSTDHRKHNTAIVGLLSASLIGFLWSLPEDFPRFYTKDPTFRQFKEAFTKPPLLTDGDWWFWNYVGHPYVGMQEYLLERNWGASPTRAFLFSTAMSLAWEYGFEAWMERPSIEDMLLTSPAGMVLGEGIYQLTQRLRRNGFSTPEKLVIVVINPFYVLQHGFR